MERKGGWDRRAERMRPHPKEGTILWRQGSTEGPLFLRSLENPRINPPVSAPGID